MLTSQEINYLGQCLNTNWAGSPLGEFRTPTMAINADMLGDTLTCKYTTIVHLVSERNLQDQVKSHKDEALKLLKKHLAEVKKEFKSLSGRTLRAKEVDAVDSVELITTSPYTPRKTAYYRMFISYKVE